MEERISIISVVSLLLLRQRHCLALTVALLPERGCHSHFLAGAGADVVPAETGKRMTAMDWMAFVF